MYQLSDYEYVCATLAERSPAAIEHLLDRYGAEGWRLAGFLQEGGATSGLCVYR